ncbi:MAG: hypothetical protein LUH14_00935 [Clostridiaceae bacterium]|nr:hypothetical protein [Clostridiaceae bacterium]
MRINHNISAQLANVNLKKTDSKLSSVLESLSSGYKINKASDDSVGLAISNKMRTQIRALDRASQNADDGVSIIQTAEGSLSEIESILLRIRELSVEAGNDTYTADDRTAIEAEVDSLLDEVDRIAETAEYNGKGLLDGSCERAVTFNKNGFDSVYVNESVDSGEYQITLTKQAEAAKASLEYEIPSEISINGQTISISGSDTDETVLEKVIETCSILGINASASTTSQSIELETCAKGSGQYITYRGPNDTESTTVYGVDAEAEAVSGFSDSVVVRGNGEYLTFTDNSGFEMEIHVDEDVAVGTTVNEVIYDAGAMVIQIGANENQNIAINFHKVTCETLGLREADGDDIINLGSGTSGTYAIDVVDAALSRISTMRSQFGAYENRLDSVISSLDISNENLTDSMSRIMDTDMASAMTNYTQLSVLSEATTAMLAQANNRPQQIMTLIQS